MKGPHRLIIHEDQWVTSMGGAFPGKRVVMRGRDLHADLMGKMDWMELFLFAITGRNFNPNQLKVLNAVWTVISFPDPRIWCNRVVSLGGTARSTGGLAISAGLAIGDASIYGQQPIIRSLDFLLRTQQALNQGIDLQDWLNLELKKFGKFYGFGRPIATQDERVPHLLRIANEAGLSKGPFVVLVFKIEELLLKFKENLHMNIAGLYGALAADMGITAREWGLFTVACFLAGMPPCFLDATDKEEGCFFPIRCDRINYMGIQERIWE